MVRLGLPIIALLVLGLATLVAGPGDDADSRLRSQLAVQAALQQGRDNLKRGDYQAAVYALESKIAQANGDRDYLNALREAYRGYIRELQQCNRKDELPVYLLRLQILDPGSALEMGGAVRPAAPAVTARPAIPSPPEMPASTKHPASLAELASRPEPTGARSSSSLPAARDLGVTSRAQMPEDDPFSKKNSRPREDMSRVMAQADEEFSHGHYRQAGRLFEQVHRANPQAAAACKDQWAYCKYSCVIEQLNHLANDAAPPAELEQEVRLALSMSEAPRLKAFGNDLLQRLGERRPDSAAARINVRHTPAQGHGWSVAETDNFRIMHQHSPELAEKMARVAETTRASMSRKWFGDNPPRWEQPCYVYLYPTKQDYARTTGAPLGSPGHSTFQIDHGRALLRRMDMRADEPHMLDSVLPHETTHVVLAGRFGTHEVPRWVDEGVAVLTEPRARINLHLDNLPRHRSEGHLFAVADLMRQKDYPQPQLIGPFYAQSVSLVEYLSSLPGGPRTFAQFVRDGLDHGYEQALRRHYGLNSFADLEQRWQAHAFRAAGETYRASSE